MLDLMVNRVDLFGKPVALNFNGRNKSKSFIGAVFSFIVFGFVVWAAYFYSQDMFKKRNPRTITSQAFSENPDEIIIEPDTFAFGFGVQHPETFAHYIDDRIYTVVVDRVQLVRETHSDGTVNEIWATTPLETEPCTTDHYGKLGHKFVDIELNKLICIKEKQSALEEIRIQGVFESPTYEYIRSSIKACDNSTTTNPDKCVTPKELTYYLGGGFFAVYFTNIAIDPKNYTDPNINYRDSIFTSTTYPYFKEVTLWLNHLQMKSDIGWLVEEANNLNFVSFDKTVENLNFRQDMGSVLNLIVRVGKITTYYERSYTKISEILAEVNGLTAAVFIAAAIILYPYSNIKFYESLINDLFDITMLKKQQDQAEADGANNKELKRANSKMGKTLKKQTTQMKRSPTMSPIQIPSPTLSVPQKGHLHLDMSEIDLSKSIQPSARDVSPNETKKQQVLVNDKAIQRKNKKSSSVIQKTRKLSFAPKLLSPSSITVLDDKIGDSERQNFDKSASFYERELPKSSLRLTNLLFPPRGDDSSQFDISSHQASFQEQTKSPKPTRKMLDRYETGSPSEMNLALENLIIEQTEKNQAQARKGSIRKSARFTTRKFEKILEQVADPESMNEADSVDEAFSPNTREGIRRAEVKQRGTKLTDKLVRDSDRINITFWEYLRSFFWRNDSIKEKFRLLNEGIRRIEERLDIFNVFKKFREIDKMKLLLLEHEQLVLFDSLPKPELAINPDQQVDPKTSKSISHLRETRFISEKRRNDLILLSYENTKNKYDKTIIDERLLQIYDDIIDY